MLALAFLMSVAGYVGEVEADRVQWVVNSPGQAAAQFINPLPAGSIVEGARAVTDAAGRIAGVEDEGRLSFTVQIPLEDPWIRPPFLADGELHRVVVRGRALDFSRSGLRAAMRFRSGVGVSAEARDLADGVLGSTTFGSMPIYLQHPAQLDQPFAVAQIAVDGGRGAVWFVVAAFGAVLMMLVVLYRRLGRRARWEKTKVQVDRIVGDPL